MRILTLPDQEPNADTGHIEPVQPCLNVQPDILRVPFPLPLQHTLRHRRHRRVVSLFNRLQQLRKVFVVFMHFWWPFNTGCFSVISVWRSQL